MKVIKNINNNTSICLDSNNQEVVAFGKGIGFIKPPYEIDISKVERTFYDVNPDFVQMINLIPDKVFELSVKIVNYAQQNIEKLTNSNIIFTLADHINFAIKRCEEKMVIDVPVYYDIQHLYPHEFAVGEYALKEIKKVMSIQLPKEEIIGIALHLINAKAIVSSYQKNEGNNDAIESITHIIESFFSITVERKSFNYARFVSHIQFQTLTSSFPSVYECAKQIDDYIFKKFNYTFNDEEILYLMLHINRLCAREDCYQ